MKITKNERKIFPGILGQRITIIEKSPQKGNTKHQGNK